MPKDAFWFPHDSNARNDPDIVDMLCKYGWQGYGWFWALIEMMREQSDYKLKQCKCNTYAKLLDCQPQVINEYISDCVSEYHLFDSDGEFFWSNSLLRRMENKDKVSETRRGAAQKRWSDAYAMQMHSKCNASAMQNDAIRREEKRREEKIEEEKTPKNDCSNEQSGARKKFVPPTVEEVAAYCRERGNTVDAKRWHNSYTAKGWMIGKSKMKDWKAAVRTWENGEVGTSRRNDGGSLPPGYSDTSKKNYSEW